MACVQKARRRMFILGALGVALPISRLFRTERFELLHLSRDRDLRGRSLDSGGSEEAGDTGSSLQHLASATARSSFDWTWTTTLLP